MGILLINKVVRLFVLSDFFLMSAWGLIGPIMAIFIVDFIKTSNPAMVAGTAAGIYWIIKAILQIPISGFLDRKKGEKDDYYSLMIGMCISSFIPIGYIFASAPWHIYSLEAVHAAGMAMVLPAWSGIFTRHIEKGHEAMSWGFDSSALSFGAGIAGLLGGTLVGVIGFPSLFMAVTALGLISAFLIWAVHNEILPRQSLFSIGRKEEPFS